MNKQEAEAPQLYTVDTKALIAHMGGVARLMHDLKRCGFNSIERKGVEKWQLRQRLPCHRLADIMALATMLEKPIDLNQFIIPLDPKHPWANK